MNGQVRVTFIENDFNKIVELTNESLEKSNEESQKDGKKFFDKIMTYSYVKDGKVTMNLYPSEARFLINLLNRNSISVVPSKNWMEELIAKKEEYKKSKESDLNA